MSFSDCVINDVMRNYFYFLIGFYANKLIVNLVSSENKKSLAYLTGVILIFGNIFLYNNSLNDGVLIQITMAVCGCLFTFFISRYWENSTILNYIGKCSLAVYVLQGLSIAATRQAMAMVYQPHANEIGWIPWIVCTLMGVFIPILIYWLSTKVWKLDFVFTPTKYFKFK